MENITVVLEVKILLGGLKISLLIFVERRLLFEDLCTKQEIEKMAQRIRAAKLLSEGKTYNQVIEETDISSATLSRVSKALRYGKGYKKFI